MRKVTGKPFCNQEVRLDGYEYSDCSFQSCRFVYSAKRPFRLIGNVVSADCQLECRGKAAETVDALADLYALGDWGKKSVSAALERIAPDLKPRGGV